jgi:DNA-binding CsgD family transcriptional regulator
MSGHPDQLVARYHELVRLNKLVRDLVIGNGSVVLVEGEPGVGKTTIVDSALHGSALAGCQVLRTTGDPLTEPLPLRMILKCLRVEDLPGDPERAGLSALLGSGEPGSVEVLSGDGIVAAVERVIVLIERMSAAAPLIVVLDDLQWADDATLRLCQRLASMINQLRVLLVGVCRPVPRRPALIRLRQTIKDLAASGHAELIRIPPLPQDAVDELVGRVVGAPPGPRLRALVSQAAGNPLYIREILHALTREHVLDRDGQLVDARDSAAESLPDSLIATIDGRLDFLSAATLDLLRMAALLGVDFAVEDLTVVLGKPPAEFIEGVEEAMAAGVLTESDLGLRFRHGLIQLACYNRIPRSLRIPLHRQAARALSESGAQLARVAEQVIPSARLVDRWLLDWLSDNLPGLTAQAPRANSDLLRNAIRVMGSDDPRYDRLAIGLVRTEFMLGNNAEMLAVAESLLGSVADSESAAEISWFACHACLRKGLLADGLRIVHQACAAVNPRSRLLPVLRVANATLCAATGDFDDAQAILDEVFAAIDTGQAYIDDGFLPGYAMYTAAVAAAYQGNNGRALELLDLGLAALAANPLYRDLRLAMAFDRLLALQNLDRLPDTELLAGVVRDIEQSGSSMTAVTHAMVAELYLRSGRWTEALTEIESAGDTGDNEMATLLCGGISAYISAHRGDWSSAHRQLTALAGYSLTNVQQRHDGGYLLMARAAAAEHDNGPTGALAVLALTLEPGNAAGYFQYLWLPETVRLALLTGDSALAEATVAVAEQVAASEPSSKAKAITAGRCRALVEGDTAPLLAAAEYHQSVRQFMEAARSLEDGAVVAVANGDASTARAAFTQAVELYSDLGAEWDLSRLDGRMRQYGMRRGRRSRPARPTTGWESLTPTELKIAGLIATGCSNPDIAAEFYLSRRTVETHVSHILTKIDGRSRSEIAREVVRHSSRQPA